MFVFVVVFVDRSFIRSLVSTLVLVSQVCYDVDDNYDDDDDYQFNINLCVLIRLGLSNVYVCKLMCVCVHKSNENEIIRTQKVTHFDYVQ